MQKVCPIVLDRTGARILAFRHPLAGIQLVKGGREAGETPAEAACRELREEAGLIARAARPVVPPFRARDLRLWHVLRVTPLAPVLPRTWTHPTEDDGGLDFRFFWHPLAAPLGADAHPLYRDLLDRIRPALRRQPAG